MFLPLDRPCKPRLLVLPMSLLGWAAVVLSLSLCLNSAPAWAQAKTEDTTDKKGDEAKIPEPEEVDLKGKDGLVIKVTYFPGTKGKESIPVILLHGFNKDKGSRKDFTQEQGLASYLQEKLGCAVVVPDLRGYGESTVNKKNGNGAEEPESKKKKAEEVKRKQLLRLQIMAMLEDLRAVKEFLWKKNNEKALNLNKLVVIGSEEGAALAIGYACDDAHGYEQGQPNVGPVKLGKFVKALVLVSPKTKFKNCPAPRAMNDPDVYSLQALIAVGNKNADSLKEAESLYKLFKRPPRPREDDLKIDQRTLLFLSKIATPLQGVKLLAEPSLKVPEKIHYFLTVRVVKHPDVEKWEWKELKQPY